MTALRLLAFASLLLSAEAPAVETWSAKYAHQGWQFLEAERLGGGERYAALTREQRLQMREQMRQHWQQISPDQREPRQQRLHNALSAERQPWREQKVRTRPDDGRSRGVGRGQNTRNWP